MGSLLIEGYIFYSGIGKDTARDLHKRGAKVIMACRNLESAENAALEIKSLNATSKQATGELVIKKLDLSSLASVRAFAEEINGNEEHVDILINNTTL